MSRTLEIPEPEVAQLEALLDNIIATTRRIAEEAPRRDAEIERLTEEGRAVMQNVWATIEHVEKTL